MSCFLASKSAYLTLKTVQKGLLMLLHRSVGALRVKAHKKGWNCLSKKWHLTFSFSKDDERLAFIAGFIQADGRFTKSSSIDIEIAKGDKHLLEWICATLQLDFAKIKTRTRTDSTNGNHHILRQSVYIYLKH